MPTPIDLFDYDLPPKFIAQQPMEPRDASKLMVLDHHKRTIEHKQFFHLINYLRPGDVVVLNNTKVFKARLEGRITNQQEKQGGGKNTCEVFLLREHDGVWEALARPGKKLNVGSQISLVGQINPIRVLEKHEDGTVLLDFGMPEADVLAYCEQYGEVPIPPYVEKTSEALQNYQTVYAQHVGAVAAPTAGFHFTQELFEKMKAKRIQIECVTLHVGLGTFLPVKTATLEEHKMHPEFVRVDLATADRIHTAKREGRRIIAVGTTVVRTLEATQAKPYSGDVTIFITPGYQCKIIDAMITNFHLPQSTLLALVSAFAGREFVLQAYEEAKKNNYRFYSFGDAMVVF